MARRRCSLFSPSRCALLAGSSREPPAAMAPMPPVFFQGAQQMQPWPSSLGARRRPALLHGQVPWCRRPFPLVAAFAACVGLPAGAPPWPPTPCSFPCRRQTAAHLPPLSLFLPWPNPLSQPASPFFPQKQRAAAPISLQRAVSLSTQPAPLLPYGRAAPTLPDLFSCARYCLGTRRRLPKCSHVRASFFSLLWPSPFRAWWLASLLLARSLVVQRQVAAARRARHLFDAMPSQVAVRRQPPVGSATPTNSHNNPFVAGAPPCHATVPVVLLRLRFDLTRLTARSSSRHMCSNHD
ncbi:uncharacterized protein [Zea mays]|uniref:Uncharacterized protein n=1 Tax=Zea mays TaxID=4577 RepID=C4J945_MAIZE|nr:uncharacterized protein LOC100502192 [Zea mays]XP_035819068.1 uncharacterized protein LOC100502192 isoform X1 [Zea mays]ACR37695.1 unknown [Zea mays]|eukprot:NP_001183598.1 uncharacterized protein LOC100502192 [Zea mays]